MFLLQQKLSFLGSFSMVSWPEIPQILLILLKFWPVMTYKMMHQICYSFYWSIKKCSKLGQKTEFLVHFERIFVYALLHSMSYTSRFCQLKDLIKIHICGKSFISIAQMVVKFKIFKVIRINSASWSGPSFGIFGPYSPKHWSILLKTKSLQKLYS